MDDSDSFGFNIYVTDHKILIINNISEVIGYAWI